MAPRASLGLEPAFRQALAFSLLRSKGSRGCFEMPTGLAWLLVAINLSTHRSLRLVKVNRPLVTINLGLPHERVSMPRSRRAATLPQAAVSPMLHLPAVLARPTLLLEQAASWLTWPVGQGQLALAL